MSEPSAKKRDTKLVAIVNGLPGNMGQEIAQACLRRGVGVCEAALTGPGMPAEVTVKEGEETGPEESTEGKLKEAFEKACAAGNTVIAIDFTHPTAVNKNAELYCKLKIPFIMGTTGGDRDKLMDDVAKSGNYALIAPNMCKQIVAFQAMMDTMAKTYPGAFGGYNLSITESHQSGKADTSGTAKAMVEYLNVLKGGEPYNVEDIVKLRDAESQKNFGVPEDALEGHAWHTYNLTSGDGTVTFEFKHNVCGRRTYAEGVVDALFYLADRIEEKTEKKLFDMIDVLKAGAMN